MSKALHAWLKVLVSSHHFEAMLYLKGFLIEPIQEENLRSHE